MVDELLYIAHCVVDPHYGVPIEQICLRPDLHDAALVRALASEAESEEELARFHAGEPEDDEEEEVLENTDINREELTAEDDDNGAPPPYPWPDTIRSAYPSDLVGRVQDAVVAYIIHEAPGHEDVPSDLYRWSLYLTIMEAIADGDETFWAHVRGDDGNIG